MRSAQRFDHRQPPCPEYPEAPSTGQPGARATTAPRSATSPSATATATESIGRGRPARKRLGVGSLGVLAIVAALALIATACQPSSTAPAPVVRIGGNSPANEVKPAHTVDPNWGEDLQPDRTNVPYGKRSGCASPATNAVTCTGSRHTLDVYLPTGGGSKGTIVMFHGGGFYSGDKTVLNGMGALRKQLTNGFAIVSVNYTLANADRGNNAFPAVAGDVAAALRWVKFQGPRFGLNNQKVVAAGHSAGGTLAGWAGTTANSDHRAFTGMPRVDGWISVSGILDWDAGPNSALWGDILHGDAFDRAKHRSAPVAHIDANDPPGYLIHGDKDQIVETKNVEMITSAAPDAELFVEIVEGDQWGRDLGARGHSPLGGADARQLTRWLNNL